MKGYLLVFKSKTGKDVVQLNHRLLGRISTIKKGQQTKRYYYSGELDDKHFKRLSDGCYFSTGDVNIHESQLKKIKVDIQLYDKDLTTGKGYWKNYARKRQWQVKNL